MSPATIIDVTDTEGLRAALRRPGLELPLLPFRQALLAVKPHAAGPKDLQDLQDLQTVRIIPGPRNAHIVATDRYTVALAAARVTDCTIALDDPIDLAVDDVAKVLAVFKMPADKETWSDCVIRIEPHDSEVSFTDAGGLFDGQELTVPMHPRSAFPDVRALLGSSLAKARALAYPPSADRGLPPTAIAKLQVAVKTYEDSAWLQAVSTKPRAPFLVLVGDRFIGLINPTSPPDDNDRHDDWNPTTWRETWAEELPRGEES